MIAEKIRAGFVQTDPRFGDVTRNLEGADRLVRSAPDFDVLVLPELFSTGYCFRDRAEVQSLAEDDHGPTVAALLGWAAARGGWLVGGFAERDGSRLFNSSALVGPDGTVHVYRKVHLFDRETLLFDPGDRPFCAADLETRSGRVRAGVMICFDWRFPEAARSLALDGAEVVLHPSNLVLDVCPEAMITRCLENGVFAVTANRVGQDDRGELSVRFTGRSQITGPRGGLLARAPRGGEWVRVEALDLTRARDKRLNDHNDLLRDRRPETYRR
ncbi:MAG: nitrilase-related carbon-nitrogen hydrolase [Candidatus Eiseniibacteriota bacterium]